MVYQEAFNYHVAFEMRIWLLSLGVCWAQICSVRSQVNSCQARLPLSSLCLILELKFAWLFCIWDYHSSCLKLATVERSGISHGSWISFMSASENLKRLRIHCCSEYHKFTGAVTRRNNYDNLFWPSASYEVPPVVFREVYTSQFNNT